MTMDIMLSDRSSIMSKYPISKVMFRLIDDLYKMLMCTSHN